MHNMLAEHWRAKHNMLIIATAMGKPWQNTVMVGELAHFIAVKHDLIVTTGFNMPVIACYCY